MSGSNNMTPRGEIEPSDMSPLYTDRGIEMRVLAPLTGGTGRNIDRFPTYLPVSIDATEVRADRWLSLKRKG
ncbi:hypothetical protein YTPLAS72_00730 [Nitrospira sp.]|nr:hypothetical protein YTPLAS72_00730 [Nitrospira sp.]